MARLRIGALALLSAAFVTAGMAAAGSTVAQKSVVFSSEWTGSQTLTWAVDGRPPYGGASCPAGDQTFIGSTRGGGRLTFTFSGRDRHVPGLLLPGGQISLGGGGEGPAHGALQGKWRAYLKSEGYWDPSDLCDIDSRLGPPYDEDWIDPTDSCGSFSGRMHFGFDWRAGKLHVEGSAGSLKPVAVEECPLLKAWPSASESVLHNQLDPWILGESAVPLNAQEVRSGDTISRTKTITISSSPPDAWGMVRGEVVNTWTVTLTPTGKRLRAVPEAAPVYRGGRVTLDGSKSRGEIRSYRGELARASGCPKDVRFASETLRGAKASFTALCPFKATLTVSDGESTDSATMTVAVRPRPWKTSFSTAADGVLDSKLVDGFLQLGRNVCAYDGLTGEQTSGHILHRSGAGGDHQTKGGFTVAEVKSGPFDGNVYVVTYRTKIYRAALVSKDFLGTSDLNAANSDAGRLSDFLALRASVLDHEHLHTTLIWEYLRKSDRAKRIEAMIEADEEALSDRVNVALVEFETALTEATSDAKVKARMPARWNRSATVKLRDGGGGFVSRTFPSLAQLGDEGVG